MSKKGFATGAAVTSAALRPGGGKKIMATLLVIVFLGLGMIGALVWWMSSAVRNAAEAQDEPLPCPPAVVKVEPLTTTIPTSVTATVVKAVEATGRTVEVVEDGGDLRFSFWKGTGTNRLSARTLVLGSTPTQAEITNLIEPITASCEAPKPTAAPAPVVTEAEPPEIAWAPWWPWPVASAATWIAVALIVWTITVPVVMTLRRPTPDHLISDRRHDRHERKEALK